MYIHWSNNSTMFKLCILWICSLNFFFYLSATFRKLFPEYVEKYEEQVAAEQSADQVAQESTQDGNSGPTLKKRGTKEDLKNVEALKELNNQQRRRSVPTWLLLLLVFIFASVMALPLLQLWCTSHHQRRILRVLLSCKISISWIVSQASKMSSLP